MTIQQLNDAFRTSLSTDLERIVMTSGVARLDAETIGRRDNRSDPGFRPYLRSVGKSAVCNNGSLRSACKQCHKPGAQSISHF